MDHRARDGRHVTRSDGWADRPQDRDRLGVWRAVSTWSWDAFLLFVLSVLVWQSGKTGAWVILIGTLRYLFVVGGRLWAALEAELPPSARRKVICVVQGVTLLVCLGPIVPGRVARVVAAGALVALVYSFAVDVRWLASNAGPVLPRDATPPR